MALAVLLAAGVALTWGSWSNIFEFALRDPEQSQVRLAPMVALSLAWIRRGRLRHCPRDGRWIGPVFVAVGWMLHSGGDLLRVQAAWHLGAVLVAVGCFLSFAGIRYLQRLLPAFVALVFLVPVPGVLRTQIAMPLQDITADATRSVLGALGVASIPSGNVLTVNGQEVLITEASSGLRMMFALLLVSYTFAFAIPIRNSIRLLIVALSPLTALLCNVIRLVPTVLAYGYVSKRAGDWTDAVGGWVILPVAFLALLGVFRALRWGLVPVYRYTLAYGK